MLTTVRRRNADWGMHYMEESGPPVHDICLDLRVGCQYLRKSEHSPTLCPGACRPPRPWRRPGQGARCGSSPRPPTPTWRSRHATPAPSQCTTDVPLLLQAELLSSLRGSMRSSKHDLMRHPPGASRCQSASLHVTFIVGPLTRIAPEQRTAPRKKQPPQARLLHYPPPLQGRL